MSVPDLPSNSKEQRQPEKKEEVRQVVRSEVVRRKKPLGRRFYETFFGGGDARTVWSFVTAETLVPAIKDVFFDVIQSTSERMIYGEVRPSRGRTTGRYNAEPYTAYNRMGGNTRQAESHDRHRLSHRARSMHDFNEIIIPIRAEAEEVLDRLYELISKYGTATVADLYDLCGFEGSFTDDKWGWVELPGARVQHVRNGYLLDLPRPGPLD